MSDFVTRDLLPDLWEEILQRHWRFLETEEGIQKIEERKKLEGCLKEFLCVVPHDRKFFLPETSYVLRQSIREMDDFTAYKAIIGFESISQYANNLFTKPWRKEFRILKMYSGFFQHEINSNLVDAVKLFEAMGYRRLSDEILVLDGPICPDQVTNVSRDAMAAFVECQIMKHVYAGITAMGLKCSWQDVFHYREKYVGGASQTIKGLASAIQERRHRKEKLSNDNAYATIQHLSGSVPAPPPPPLVSQCANCTPYHHNTNFMQTSQQQQCALHSNQLPNTCTLHPTAGKVNLMCNGSSNSGKLFASYPAPGSNYHNQSAQQMSHSRSLEHYNEPPPLLPHRHSFDHQQQGCSAHQGHYQIPRTHNQFAQHLYESPYDCIDGVGGGGDGSLDGSSVSYAAVAAASNSASNAAAYAHPYNVSGNRYPLPYNISHHLNSQYAAAPASVTCNGVKDTDAYGENAYATVSKSSHNCNYRGSQQPPLPPARNLSSHTAASKEFQAYRQRSFPPDQLIDFDDRAPLTAHDYHVQQHIQWQKRSLDHCADHRDHGDHLEREYDLRAAEQRRAALVRTNGLNPMYAQPKDLLCQQHVMSAPMLSSDEAYNSSLYARPVPRSSRVKDAASMMGPPQTKQTTDKYVRNMDCMQGYDNNRKLQMELKDRLEKVNGVPRRKLSAHARERNASDDSETVPPFDDFVTVGHSEHPQRSPTQAVKNRDGVGSFESWDYVFQNLERTGYNKDLGERGDLLVQSLDLDSLNLANGGSGGGGGGGSQNNTTEKRRPTETKTASSSSRQISTEKSRTLDKVLSAEKRESKSAKQEKVSILKQPNSAASVKKTKSTLKTTSSSSGAVTAVAEHSKSNGTVNSTRSTKRQSSNTGQASSGAAVTRASNAKTMPVATQIIVNSPNEWSCPFCTFLNPDTKRICEICSRSKDFNLEATASNTPTCV